jgi:RNA polymerase sigma factor (sigma-70 family)
VVDPRDSGARLAAQARWLELLLTHLASPRVRALVAVEDLTQEVFLRACTAAELPQAEEGEAPLRRLLARIARHVVVDVVRATRAAKRGGGRRELSLDRSSWSHVDALGARADELAASTLGPATRAARADEHMVLQAALERLDPAHRRVIGLRQFEGLDARTTARRMGRSEAAVHSLYRRALQAWSEAVAAGRYGG